MSETPTRRRYVLSGMVQGVGLRYRARHAAALFGVTGWVRNELSGDVTMELQGSAERISQVLAAIERGSYIRVEDISVQTLPLEPDERGFAAY